MTDPDFNQRVRVLFDAALERSRADRRAFVRRASGGDVPVFEEVCRLLEAYEGGVENDSAEHPDSGSTIVGILGNYELLRVLGEGGMGTVYLARRADGAFDRLVAVKLIREDRSPSDAVQRFARERRLLASLKHPGIATLFDAGETGDGQPYFVMEYIDGLPITEFCDRRRLSVRDRLALFTLVCEAVASAHRVPIVHCDLKPANILVDSDGRPHVLDFGIATALTRGGLEADAHLAPYGSPQYASPEQLRGDPVQTISDVYSLGVVLYELLVGTRPGAIEARAETAGQIDAGEGDALRAGSRAEVSPETAAVRGDTPTGLLLTLTGDLDAILLKSTAQRWEARYASVDALLDDLQRYLRGFPVSVRAPTRLYVVSRFASRHPWGTAGGVFAGLLLATAIAVILGLWRSAERGRLAAEARFKDVRSLATSLFEVDTAIATTGGGMEARQKIVESAARYLDRLSQDGSVDPTLAIEVAEGYRRLGDMLGNPNLPNLGRREDALRSYETAQRHLRMASPDAMKGRAGQLVGARIDAGRGDVLLAQRQLPDARAAYERAAAVVHTFLAGDADAADLRRTLSGIYRPLGDVYFADGNLGQAQAYYQKARALDYAMLTREPESVESRRALALTEIRTGEAAAAMGLEAEALRAYAEAERLLADASGRAPERSRLLRDLALGRMKLGQMLSSAGDVRGREELRKALQIFRELAERDRNDAGARRDLMLALVANGDALAPPESAQATSLYLEARNIGEALAAEPLSDARALHDLRTVNARLRPASQPAARAVELKLTVAGESREIPFDRFSLVRKTGEELRVSPVATSGAQYLLVVGGQGPAALLTRKDMAAAHWRVKITGPPPSQTLVLIEAPRPLSVSERADLLARLGQVASPRSLPDDTHIIWRSGQPELLDASATARGDVPVLIGWPGAFRAALESLQGVTYSGRTFPVVLR